MMELSLLNELNAGSKDERLGALKRAVAAASFPPVDPRMVNNHIHTTFSFSPYSPAAAVYAARAVMEKTSHVLLVGAGAETFARLHALDMVEPA